ncbi:GDSL-type esterase/lipase family protein [Streptomyces griseoaurantiacus]|uniref:GDSL-type esterase/lipase family protein n=1 Tax=Streptomyces griseoaurantiacus TaxID=68213 RepID=UPI0037981587
MVWHTVWNCTPLEGTTAQTATLQQRLSVTSNVHGGQLRVRLRAARGTDGSSAIDALSVAVDAGKPTPLLKHGCPRIVLESGREVLCDPVPLAVQPGATIEISCQASERQSAAALSPVLAHGQAQLETQGDLVPTGPAAETLGAMLSLPGLGLLNAVTAIEAETHGPVTGMVLFGDSITQMGFWPAALERHLRAEFSGRTAVRNLGIAGNRVLHDAPKSQPTFGPAASSRFSSQVFGDEPVGLVVVLLGVNDMVHPASLPEAANEVVTANELLAGIGAFAGSSHRHGARAVVCTIPPFFGNEAWTPQAEAVRQEVNARLATETSFDAVVDLDQALASDDAPTPAQRDDFHIGDRLHPNPEGGEAIAFAIMPALRHLLSDMS